MAYMPDRHAVLTTRGPVTWERKNGGWTQVADTGPELRSGVAYDDSRSRVVMMSSPTDAVDGFLETWEWDGSAWTQVADFGPSIRHQPALTYDSNNKQTVLFGGRKVSSEECLNETWTWDGTRWTLASDMGPPARSAAALTYDVTKQRSLLFGGQEPGGGKKAYGDTWAWDGEYWRQLSDMGPSPRAFAALCYDRARERGVLFGGRLPGMSQGPNDTWEFFAHS
jgi:hypothetical protein